MSTNTYAVLSDHSTFDSVEGVILLQLNDNGETALEEYGEIPELNDSDIQNKISLRDVLDFYNRHHGTNY